MIRQKQDKKLIVGLTGDFGSGKSTVAGIFKSLGAKIIDADKIGHSIIKRRSEIYKKIINKFGKGILKTNKSIDRYKLGRIVFNNRNSLKRLNKIMHPEIIKIIKECIKTSRAKFIVLDAPLLLEAGLRKIADKLVVVKINRKEQLKRLLNKTHLDKIEILRRIKRQISQNVKSRFADFVIDNSGTINETRKQVKQIRRLLWKN